MDVLSFLKTPDAFDLLHFACHGEADSDKIWDSGLLLDRWVRPDGQEMVDPFRASDVGLCELQHADGTRPIVFLNACQVGRSGQSLTGTGGLAQAFVRQGAGLLVGALWSVGDAPALTFAEQFYEQLKAGRTVAQAGREARTIAKKQLDSTWLAYTIYGHPYARLAISN